MNPSDFSFSSIHPSPSDNQSRKRDLFEPPFDPWDGSSLNSNNVDWKKPRYDPDDNDFDGCQGSDADVNEIVKRLEEEEAEESELDFKRQEMRNDVPICPASSSDREEVRQADYGDCGRDIIEKKTADEPDEDPDPDASSPTTPVQSSSEPEPTPRSSNEGDGEKSDKAESENGKSVHLPSTSNGGVINYISPSITKRSVTLQMLLAAAILKPGEGTMSLEYHGQKFIGDLLENGQIRSQETSQIFSSPSAWATTCKQIINPDKSLRKSGCGWASIKYKSLKLDYYKAVWFKRLREGSIDIRNISNGAVSSSSDTESDEAPHCVLKFGEHFENNPRNQTAQQLGAKILISCTEFKEMERLQPFHVKISAEALALADFHCNITSTEAVGYLSGQWNGDQNTLKIQMIHPCRILMPNSSTVECDNERNRIALEIQRFGHEVVGWYHSHPKAPPIPSKDDISRQLDYQIMMKGASEASYVPCVGIIISPLCYSEQSDLHKSNVQFFWAMPPPENRPLEIARPMHIDYDTYPSTEFDPRRLSKNMNGLIDFYKTKRELVDVNELGAGKLDRLREAVSTWLPALRSNEEFWSDAQSRMKNDAPAPVMPPHSDISSSSSSSSAQLDEGEPDVEDDESSKLQRQGNSSDLEHEESHMVSETL